jgi:hypothetical protein
MTIEGILLLALLTIGIIGLMVLWTRHGAQSGGDE